MVSVSRDHIFYVAHGQILPGSVAQVMPARQFFPNHQAQFVACVEKSLGLRIMRAANEIAIEIAPKDFRIVPQHSWRHRKTDVREQLVPVQPENAEALAIQNETVHFKPGVAKADSPLGHVHRLSVLRQRRFHAVQSRRVHIPKRHVSELRQR
jgi:hypothetical protein